MEKNVVEGESVTVKQCGIRNVRNLSPRLHTNCWALVSGQAGFHRLKGHENKAGLA